MSDGEPINATENQSHRERLSQEETGNLLASFGNNEAKALLVAKMQPGVIYTKAKLQQLFNSAQGEHPGWKVDHVLHGIGVKGHCNQ